MMNHPTTTCQFDGQGQGQRTRILAATTVLVAFALTVVPAMAKRVITPEGLLHLAQANPDPCRIKSASQACADKRRPGAKPQAERRPGTYIRGERTPQAPFPKRSRNDRDKDSRHERR